MYFVTDKHKKFLMIFGFITCFVLILVLLFHYSRRTRLSKNVLKIEKKPEKKVVKKELKDMPFFVFSTSVVPYPRNFAPSGFMGDKIDIKMTGSYDIKLKETYPCLKFIYYPTGEKKWAGIIWQNPPNNWGDYDGGYDLSKATKLTFWARGDVGGEVVEFKIGGISSTYKDSVNVTSGDVILEKEWIKYILHLNEFSTHYISGGFSFVVTKENNRNGCIFYLDEVRYEGD